MEEKKNPIFNRRMLLMIAAIAAICAIVAVSFYQGTAPSAQTPSTEDSTGFLTGPIETLSIEERNQMIRASIDAVVTDWTSGIITFEEASAMLTDLQQTSSVELADYAAGQLDYITVEHNGNAAFDFAQKFLGVKNYIQVFTYLNKIDSTYSKYEEVQEFYVICEERILQAIENPMSIAEFEAAIQLLNDCELLYKSEALSTRKKELSEELVVFIDVTETIEAATVQFDAQNIEESFVLLVLGLDKYPDNEMLATTLVNFRDHYLITISKKAVDLCEREEYKEAVAVVETAIEEYDCPEFRSLLEAIKEEKSFLYRLKNDIVAGFNALSNGWKEEKFDVKSAASDAGAYIVKSGKKLALGDYSEENVTLLSFSGNIASSLLGVDLLFDLRDLSYDITHWGEDEYFAIWLAADVVAVLPVVGVVKYLSHFKTAADGVDVAAELVDSVGDVSKNAENAAELADTVSDVTKIGADIVDAIDDVKSSTTIWNSVKDTIHWIAKEYTPINTINHKLVGKKHEKSGVEFVLSKITFSDGRKVKGVFPKFNSYVDIKLPDGLYKADFPDQQKECLRQLQEKLKNPWNSLRKKFTEEQLEDIAAGVLPDGFTWHHNEREGLMQLVDTLEHSATGHTGGMSLWGNGHK